jgi:hypothetical protein
MLPADWNLDVSNSSHLGISQQLEGYSLIDEQVLLDSQVLSNAASAPERDILSID